MSEVMRYRVWDGPVRLFHWAVVLIVLAQWASAEWNLLSMDWHFRLGYVMLGLVIWRVLWGFFGSENARFAHFLRGPAAIASYAPTTLERKPDAMAGHNPLGGWAVIALLAVLLVQAGSGLFSSDDIFRFGPLAERVSADTMDVMSDLHETLTDVLIALIAVHLAAIGWHLAWKRENLITPMITGRRAFDLDPGLRFAGWLRALALGAVSGGVVWAIVAWGQSG
jgi:cytochrome b